MTVFAQLVTYQIYICMCMYIHAYMHYACIHTYIHSYIHTCAYVYIYICMCMCLLLRICMHMQSISVLRSSQQSEIKTLLYM